MKIKRAKVQNYRSLENIELKNLNGMIILIGKNSSGKTNILEAIWLFFKDFSLSPVKSKIDQPLASHDYMWFGAITEQPIVFEMEIELAESEFKNIVSEDLRDSICKTGNCRVKIQRQIEASPPDMYWETISVELGDITLVKDGKMRSENLESKELLNLKLSKEKLDKEYVVAKKDFDNRTANIGAVDNFGDLPRIEQQVDEIQRKLAKIKNATTRQCEEIIQKITDEIQGKTTYLLASRSKAPAPSNYGIRNSTIEDSMNAKIIQMGESYNHKIRKNWKKLQGDFKEFCPSGQELAILQKQSMIEESVVCIPLYLAGAGTQDILILLSEIQNAQPILLIEEPELHLHPDLTKKLFRFLKTISETRQVWVSTQSPFFLDKSEINNIAVVTRKNGETSVFQLADKVELKAAIAEIGVRPSDLLFADVIVLVDGITEEDVFPIWAKTLGLDLDQLGVTVISIGGGQKEKHNLKMWREITRNAEIPVFLFLDAHSQKEAQKMIEDGLLDSKSCIVLKVNSIEEFYPKSLVLKAINENFGITFKQEELTDTKAETIKKALEQKGMQPDNWWKPILGVSVAKMMSKEEIPEDIKKLFEKISLTLDIK